MELLLSNLLSGAEIIAGFAAAGALILTYFTFRSFNKSEETKLTESVFKDIRSLEEQKYKIEERPKDKHDAVSLPDRKKGRGSLFFNTLEWLSYLINRNKIKDKKNIAYFKKSILEWHKENFLWTI